MDFRQRLIAAADAWPVEQSRLLQLLANPRTPQSLLQQFALSTLAGAHSFAHAIALLFCRASHPQAKAFLFDNLLEETGMVLRGDGARYRPAQEHTAWARRFCHACGLDDAALDAALATTRPWPPGAFALIGQNRWQEAIAYLVVGYERASPRYMRGVHQALLGRGFRKEDLVFFHNHIAADEAHGERGVDILVALASDPAMEARLLAQVIRGAGDFWQGLNGANHAASAG